MRALYIANNYFEFLSKEVFKKRLKFEIYNLQESTGESQNLEE